MIRLLGSLAGMLLFSALLLLVVDIRIYSNRRWHREKKYAKVIAWSYILLSLMICIGLLLYI
ncbi:CLC_0170 family protein [Paenibacillus sp. FSL R7-0204]|uniref:CLC_0170 family protein n=1 Tax=Paenibacillus sp. FSL R7-0204 TaxID=2921675 RepID=UPI0030F8E478